MGVVHGKWSPFESLEVSSIIIIWVLHFRKGNFVDPYSRYLKAAVDRPHFKKGDNYPKIVDERCTTVEGNWFDPRVGAKFPKNEKYMRTAKTIIFYSMTLWRDGSREVVFLGRKSFYFFPITETRFHYHTYVIGCGFLSKFQKLLTILKL